jgi:glyoxylase-like metal-dependent hydrolase (beta-lactamase superfamily II)
MACPDLPDGLLWIEPVSSFFPHSCNSFAVWENDGTWSWIDPGAAGDENLERLRSELERLELPLSKLGRIIITHAHVDHFCAAGMLSELADSAVAAPIPIHCHPDAAECARDLSTLVATFDFDILQRRLPGDAQQVSGFVEGMKYVVFHSRAPFVAIDPEPTLEDGQTLKMGPFAWECLLTPGHARGHIMLFDPKHQTLIAGDVIGHKLPWHSPSSGGAAAYLESVERIAKLDVTLLLPAHGDPADNPRALIDKMRSKFLERETRILDALSEGATEYRELYDRSTGDAALKRLFPFGAMLEGHLERLGQLGELRELESGKFERA